MEENFNKMQMFPLPFAGILPIEIQYKIITKSERNWYDDAVNKIIDSWYLFIKRKIDITNIAIKFKKEFLKQNELVVYGDTFTFWYINPLKIEKELKYIEKIFTGTEDINFWESKFEGIARGINYLEREEDFNNLLKILKIKVSLKKIRNKIIKKNLVILPPQHLPRLLTRHIRLLETLSILFTDEGQSSNTEDSSSIFQLESAETINNQYEREMLIALRKKCLNANIEYSISDTVDELERKVSESERLVKQSLPSNQLQDKQLVKQVEEKTISIPLPMTEHSVPAFTIAAHLIEDLIAGAALAKIFMN